MVATLKCEACGAELPARAPEGLCPRCLVGMGINLGHGGVLAEELHAEAPVPATNSSARQFGNYELLGEIGRGGMGVVYRARQVSLNRIVAVKMLLFREFANPQFVRRFRSEARAGASLQHPNIVRIHEIGEEAGQPYFSMDYIEGTNLAELVRSGPLAGERAAKYIIKIAEAVEFAHCRGMLHRDLKPSNVLIDQFDEPRILDFGLAKQMQDVSRLTVTGEVLGSPAYMPPEQASPAAGPTGRFSDVYALGAVLFHLLTGRPPFVAGTLPDTLLQVLNAEPIAPRLLNPGVAHDLETICLKCLRKEPSHRYDSAQALADDLNRFLRRLPIIARPVSPLERLWRWCRRKPELAAAMGLLVFFAVASALAAYRFNQLRAEADRQREEARLGKYISDMNVALDDRTEGNAAQSVELLESNRPKSGQGDLRGFEWYYLWRTCHPRPPRSLPKHNQVLGDLVFSRNGKLLGTFCWDHVLRVWNLDTGQKIMEMTNASGIGALTSAEAEFVATTSAGSVYSFDLRSGRGTQISTNGGEMVAATPEAKTLVLRSSDGTIEIASRGLKPVRLSPKLSISRYIDYAMRPPVAISPDGKMLVLIRPGRDERRVNPEVTLCDTQTGTILGSLLENRRLYSWAFSPDGTLWATGDGTGKVRIWDLQSHQFKLLNAYDLPVSALAFTPDGQTLATGSSAPGIKLWNVATGAQMPSTIQSQAGQVWSLAFSGDGRLLASGGRNSAVNVWSVSNEPVKEVTRELNSHWVNLAISPDSRLMAAGCKGQVVKLWSVEDFSLKATLTNFSYAIAFNGKELLTASEAGMPVWWNVETGTTRPVPAYQGGSLSDVLCVALSPDHRVAALGCRTGTIELLEVSSGKLLAKWAAHVDEVRSVAFSPTGKLLVSGSRDHSVAEWEVETQKNLGVSEEHKAAICAVAFSVNASLIASGCGAGTIKVWDSRNGLRTSLSSISYHQSAIRALAFSPDERTLASGSDDRTLRLWNIQLGRQVASFQHDAPVQLIQFTPDGNTLATVTENGELRLFRAATKTETDPQ